MTRSVEPTFKCLQWAIDALPMGHLLPLNWSYTRFQISNAGAREVHSDPGSLREFCDKFRPFLRPHLLNLREAAQR